MTNFGWDYSPGEIVDGQMTVYKAVDGDLCSGWGFKYPIGAENLRWVWGDPRG